VHLLAKIELGEVQVCRSHEVILQPPVIIEYLKHEQKDAEARSHKDFDLHFKAGNKTKERKGKNLVVISCLILE
jgi:hypothetical protein